MTGTADERHAPGFDALWAESWHLDFAGDGHTGGFVSLWVFPNLKVAWWWTHLITGGRLVAVRDHEVPLPRTGLEVRADGLWADVVCETPLEHWSFGLEAFAVAYDDPDEAWGAEWGERVPLGLDLEWETLGPPLDGPLPGPQGTPEGGFLQPGAVHGDILVGPRTIRFDGTGLRSRRWGPARWWNGTARSWAGAVGADGRPVVAEPVAADAVEILGRAPVLVTGPEGRTVRLLRALCRLEGGVGWAEWLPANGDRTAH